MKKLFLALCLHGLSLSGFSQILNIWEENINQSEAISIQYINREKNSEYVIFDSINGNFNVYEINYIENKVNPIIDSFFRIPNKLFNVSKFKRGHLFSGSQAHQASIYYKTDSLSISKTRKGLKTRSILLRSKAINFNTIIAFGLISKYDPTLNPFESFDELLVYSLDSSLNYKDSLIIDMAQNADKGYFIDCFFEQDNLKAFTFNPFDSICKISIDRIKNDLSQNNRNLIQIDSSNSYRLSYCKAFYEEKNYYLINLLTNRNNNLTEVSIGKLKNEKYNEIKRIKLPYEVGQLLVSENNPDNNFKAYFNDGIISISFCPTYPKIDSIISYFSFDTLGNELSKAELNIKSYFKELNYSYSSTNQILIDSTLIVQGFCSEVGTSKVLPFFFLLKDAYKPKLILDTFSLKKRINLIFPQKINNNEFLVLGYEFSLNGIDVENYYFQKKKLLNFTLSNFEILNNSKSILIYPNPTPSQVNFTSTPKQVWVYSNTGKLVYQNHKPNPTLNLNLPNGLYFLQAQFEEGLKSQTLIIQNP